jgi:UDP-N-acetylglucosamine--N-acetylmuramyl-(pentapeptide) pyrophosphoryl-undecaprenol N-acetylglucosamine transferase
VRLIKIPFGFFQALFLLIEIKPDAIMSFGGYLAVPVVLAGWVLGIPSVTHEQTVVTGYANKLLSKFAKKILVSWPTSLKHFPPNKVVLTGLPLRKEIFEVRSDSFQTTNNLPTLYVTAGKTGSLKINEAVKEALPELLKSINIIHQCGDYSERPFFALLNEIYSRIKSNVAGKYFVRKYILSDEIGEAYNKSTFVLSRAGAHTTMEILALEKPCILVPIPWVSHNEQNENAKVLAEAGLARILSEKELSGKTLIREVKEMLGRFEEYKLVNSDLKKTIRQDSAKLIVEELLSVQKKLC